MGRKLPLALTLVALVAACGGDADEHYKLEDTQACLRRERVPVSTKNVDFVASTAAGGALHAEFPKNEVTVAFGDSEEDAARTERAYRRFAPKRININDVLRRDRNVVLLWGVAPSPEDAETISRCLNS